MLSKDDKLTEEWVSASVLTSTNRERYTLTDVRARQFALYHKTHVIRWMCKHNHWKNKPPAEFQSEALKDPLFYEYFVRGAEGFITQRYIEQLKLVNGIKIRYHSLLFEDPEQEKILERHIARTPVGEVITLPFPPLAQIVQVFPPVNTPPDILRALHHFSLCKPIVPSTGEPQQGPRRILIPINQQACKWSDRHLTVCGGQGFQPSLVKVSTLFPLETAFAITVNKSQGRTLGRIIIALSHSSAKKCNFSYSQLHVAFSRVRHRDHIRLLLTGNTEADKWHSLEFLSRLKPDPSIKYFFDGFRDLDVPNPNEGWMENKWNAQRANQKYAESKNTSS